MDRLLKSAKQQVTLLSPILTGACPMPKVLMGQNLLGICKSVGYIQKCWVYSRGFLETLCGQTNLRSGYSSFCVGK